MSTSHLRLTLEGYRKAHLSLEDQFEGKKAKLAQNAGVNRSTVIRFFQRENLAFGTFEGICTALDLDWREVGEDPSTYPTPNSTSKSVPGGGVTGIDRVVEEIRACTRSRLQHDCAAMQLFVLKTDISINEIYVNIDLLRQHHSEDDNIVDEESLQGEIDVDNFDRFGFRVPNSQRLSGEQVARNYERLLVFGKPGSGKTVYLQWLATRCCEGALFPNLVPVFLSFKDVAEAENRPSLQAYIEQYFTWCQVPNPIAVADQLLTSGRILLLIDGLDEVQETDRNRVQRQIQEFTRRFHRCRYVFSCRPPLRLQLPRFEQVLIADFKRSQIADFAQKWFQAILKQDRGKQFMDRLSSSVALAELARTPLLLTLLCRVFEADGQFPRSRSDLYRRGFEILLSEWDDFRNIARNNPYRYLKTREKEALLSRIATKFFIQQKILFWRRDVELIIEDFFHHTYKLERLRIPTKSVLDAIELQHGLIVSRASNYCSFSHLTFQEYLTASRLVTKKVFSQGSKDKDKIYQHVMEHRWRFVFELIAELLDQPDIDRFLLDIKQVLDQLVETHQKIHSFLEWLNNFVEEVAHEVSTEHLYKQTLLRAWYFVFTLEDPGPAAKINQMSRKSLEFPDYFVATSAISSHQLNFHVLFYRALHADDIQCDIFLSALKRIQDEARDGDAQVAYSVEEMLFQIQQQQANYQNKFVWWESCRPYWQQRLRELMRVRLKLRSDWNFDEEEKTLLISYYNTTRLLAECMNRSQKRSEETYNFIAENLLRVNKILGS
jgi:hypothetical protein